MKSFMQNMKVVCEGLGLRLFSIGACPNWERNDMPIMPKNRYKKIMMPYMQKVGTQGLDMMLRTCTIQVNLDYASEADMAKSLELLHAFNPWQLPYLRLLPCLKVKILVIRAGEHRYGRIQIMLEQVFQNLFLMMIWALIVG